jgi:hypothetical protein
MNATVEAPAQTRRDIQATPLRTQLAEFVRQDWRHHAEQGTQIEDILKESYWALMAKEFKPFDHIEVILETGEWIADLIVMQCDRTWAKVVLKHKFDLAPVGDLPPDTALLYTISFKGPQRKWTVIRNSDQTAVRDGFGSRSEANDWLASYEKAITIAQPR